MNIKVTFDGLTMIEGIKSGDIVQIEKGTTVKDLLYRIQVKEEFHPLVIPFVNEKPESLSYVFQDDDGITLFLPVSGG